MGMHGDLVNGLCYTLFLPAYLWLWLSNPEPGAGLINVLFLLVAAASWISWYRESCVASSIANVSMAASIAAMNFYQWPHKGEIVISPQYLWSLLIVSFNSRLPFWAKMGITANALGMALFVSVKSPLIVAAETVPTLLGATTVHALFHYFSERQSPQKGGDKSLLLGGEKSLHLDTRLASILLAGAFSYQLTIELSKMMQYEGYAVEGGFAILKVGLFASLCLAAAGGFQQTVDTKEALEALVAKRTREIELQAQELRMVNYALQASETAIAITDFFQAVVWSNASMERLVPNHVQRVRGCQLTKVLGPSPEMVDRLSACFDPKHVCMTEIAIEGTFYSVEVSPFPASGGAACSSSSECEAQDARFLVVLKDVTEQRARERAEKLAQKEAFLKQVMKDTMETLSHELRTELQGIMGMASVMRYEDETSISEENKESLSIIMASSRHLLTIINNLIDSSHPPPSSQRLLGLEETKERLTTISDLQVLVVDDTIINLKVLDQMLRDIGICKVTTTDSGKKALSLLEKEKFDLVITDIQMPEMDGLQLANAIRHNDKLPVKPIVVGLTTGAESLLQEGCDKSGLYGVLHKPVTAVQLQSFFRDTINTLQRCDVDGTTL